MTVWQTYLDEHRAAYKDELLEFLRIPSISSLSAHAPDVERAAQWVADRLRRAGIEQVEVLPTAGHPVVYGDWLHAPDKPTILIYGHFDTQPVDPIALWTNPPFDPVIRDDRVYARGASDDKGNMLAPILAVEALLQTTGTLPVNLKFFFEGQEEIGSPDMPPFVRAERERFACDLVISADGGQWGEDEPHLTIGLKGLAGLQIDVHGARSDLHSGMYGGSIQNPIHALVRLLDSMRSPDGTITVAGFYDDVVPLTPGDQALIAEVPHDDQEFLADIGVSDTFGEPGYSTLERIWARPTLEINGIWGGFQGEGVKTVLPNAAHAKITCRLVANQEPQRVLELLTAHIRSNTPVGVEVILTPLAASARPYLLPVDHWGNRAASDVLKELYGREPYYTRSGGSIPVCELFRSNLDADTIIFGFGLPDEQFHAPDEFFRLASFELGQRAYVALLERLGQTS